MNDLAQLRDYSQQIAAAVGSLIDSRSEADSSGQLPDNLEDENERNKAKEDILASVASIKSLLIGPTGFLQHLASQAEILGCLQWLAEFQILACIPLSGNVPIDDVADLAGVPKSLLARIIRLTATCGFLRVPETDLVAHTLLSAQFTTDQCLLDATIFMAEAVSPAALQMLSATRRFGPAQSPNEFTHNLGLNTTRPSHMDPQDRVRLGRQRAAYLSYAAGVLGDEEVYDVFSQLNWSDLGSACIVEVGARNTSLAQYLTKRFPGLHVIVQINNTQSPLSNSDDIWQSGLIANHVRCLYNESQPEPSLSSSSSSSPSSTNSRMTVTYLDVGMPQPVADAAVYILHPPDVFSNSTEEAPGGLAIRAELQHYLEILRISGGVMLVLTTRLLPEPGSLSNPEVEAAARARDLSMRQLSNKGEMEMVDLLSIVETVKDGMGKLVTTKKLRSQNGLVMALAVKYQAY